MISKISFFFLLSCMHTQYTLFSMEDSNTLKYIKTITSSHIINQNVINSSKLIIFKKNNAPEENIVIVKFLEDGIPNIMTKPLCSKLVTMYDDQSFAIITNLNDTKTSNNIKILTIDGKETASFSMKDFLVKDAMIIDNKHIALASDNKLVIWKPNNSKKSSKYIDVNKDLRFINGDNKHKFAYHINHKEKGFLTNLTSKKSKNDVTIDKPNEVSALTMFGKNKFIVGTRNGDIVIFTSKSKDCQTQKAIIKESQYNAIIDIIGLDENHFVTKDVVGRVKIWTLDQSEPIFVPLSNNEFTFIVSPNTLKKWGSIYLVSLSPDGVLEVFDWKKKKIIWANEGVNNFIILDEKYIGVIRKKSIEIWTL